MENNNEQESKSQVNKKHKGHGPIYWLIVIVGVTFIVAASFNLGTKFGKIVEGNDSTTTSNNNESSNKDNNSNQTSNTDSNLNSNTNNLLSDEEALELGNEQWKYASSATFCGEYKYDNNDQDSDGIAITNFDEVNSHFTNDNLISSKIGGNTAKSFKEKETANFVYKNGKYYDPSSCGRGTDISYMNTTLKIVDKKENEIKFTATSTYCSTSVNNSDCTGKTSTTDADFIIKKENGSWKIAKFYLPY